MSWLATADEALEVAREHADWARGQGLPPAAILAALGYPLALRPRWYEVVDALAAEWRELYPKGSRHEPERLPPWTDPFGLSP